MAGEFEIGDQTYRNVANTNFQPFTCVDIDTVNSGSVITAVIQATNSTEVIGVCYDQSKLNPDGTVTANSGIAVRTFGIARVKAHAAVSAGNYVSVSATDGTVSPATQTAAGSQPKAILGRALTSAGAPQSGVNDTCLVVLMIGARY